MRYAKFYRHLISFWKIELLLLLLSGLAVILSLVNPYLTKLIIDKAYGNKDLKLFIGLVIVGGIVFVLNGAISGSSNYLSSYVRLKMSFDLNCKVFKKLQGLSYSFFQGTSSSEHLYKINYDIDEVTRFLVDLLPQAFSLIPKTLFILTIVLCMNWKMAAFALMLIPLLYIVPLYFAARLKKVWKITLENSQNIFKRLQEVLSHMHLIKAFGKERSETRGYIKAMVENIRFRLTKTRTEAFGSFANSLSNRIVLGAIILYGGYQVIRGEMTLGTLSALTIYLGQLSGLQNSFAAFFQQISLGLLSLERLDKIISVQPETIEDRGARRFTFSTGRIEFRNVTFGYKDRTVLKSLNFSIDGSSCIGLVGPSGCGKTTITSLILRLYKPLGGEILIDGYNINIVERKKFYEQIGAVLQEPYLFNDSIENNIRYGKADADPREVKEAASIACIDDFIDTLPKRYDTVVGENACRISEGQKQRIAIARAVIKKPKVLILDEALSSVDAEIENRIIRNIKSFLIGSTIVIISHRISTIRCMDSVYFLSGPDKIDIGKHHAFLENNSRYQNYLAQKWENLT